MLAAVIGPIVCELEGPIPILNTSNTERNINDRLVAWAEYLLFVKLLQFVARRAADFRHGLTFARHLAMPDVSYKSESVQI